MLRTPSVSQEPLIKVLDSAGLSPRPAVTRSIPASSLRPAVRSLAPPTDAEGGEAQEKGAATTPRSRRVAPAMALGAVALVVGATVVGVRPWKVHRPHTVVQVSGTPAPRVTPSGAHEHWPVGAAIPVVLDASLNRANPGAQEAIVEAFATWGSDKTGAPDVKFTIDTTPGVAAEDGVNRILYGPITVPGSETAVAITISYADEDGTILEADTILNNAYPLTVIEGAEAEVPAATACGGTYDVQNIATHEAGHFLGLGEDLTEVANTMFITSAPCQTHKRTPTASDVGAMKSLYVGVTPTAAASGCSR